MRREGGREQEKGREERGREVRREGGREGARERERGEREGNCGMKPSVVKVLHSSIITHSLTTHLSH